MVPELDQITAVENEYCGPSSAPRLGDAYVMLEARWLAGRRDLETGLRLMFLAWYGCAEPPFLTGMPTYESTGSVFREVFDYFGGTASTEPELLNAGGLMYDMAPFCCGTAGDDATWAELAERCKKAARQLKPEGYPPEHFEGRGAYGQYFAHMARFDRESRT